MLNLASGPCRDIMEFLDEHPDVSIVIECVEMDPKAIKYAKTLLGGYADKQVHFTQANVFKFSTDKTYDLIWSAGLFDYFDDKIFASILSRYKKNMTLDGEIVIGNFHPSNRTKRIMELGNWYLHHREETTMRQLAQKAGFINHRIEIETEPEGVNLFMRIGHK